MRKEVGARGFGHWSRNFPAAPGEDHGGAGCSTAEEGATERNCYELTATPTFSCRAGRRQKSWEQRSENESAKKRGWWESGFSFVFVSPHPTLFLIGDKLIFSKSRLLS